ncbi:MAG: Mrp/NBP35 family ATP-binding protein [Candidatus Aenigmarchaeota archaeon]|nr:Mrp/NBP35 family ATP-binding protein [Candidatus Aenigmarchaeota archaeon]
MEETSTKTIERIGEQRKHVMERLGRIRRRIAVMSGKGGVGKTTVAINIAALLAENNSVGLLDADIDCPNVNKFLGITEKFSVSGGKIKPVEKYGMKIASMASLQDSEDTAIIWRGPMISHAILQFLELVEWGNLDYLIIDTPPGTSDAALTLMQLVQLSGVVIVSTPHPVSLTDANKAINMAKQMNVPVLGIIENMAGGIFGSGVEKLAESSGVPLLGSIKLQKTLSSLTSGGVPAVKDDKNLRKDFENIVKKLLLHQQKD